MAIKNENNNTKGTSKWILVLVLIITSLICVVLAALPSTTIFFNDAESGTNGWTLSGQWHLTTGNFKSPNHSWWYGQESTGNYNTGNVRNSGYLTSPPISLSAGSNLSFMSWYQTETGTAYDKKTIQISTDNGSTWTSLKQVSDAQLTWNLETIDLAGYAEKTIKIRFYFDTVDGYYNDYKGWYIDDIKIEAPNLEPLNVSVSESPDPVTSGGTTQIFVHATTTGGVPVSAASVNLSVTGGSLTPAAGTTDANGDFKSTYTAPTTATTAVHIISVSVSKTGHKQGTASDQITVTPQLYVSIPEASVLSGIASGITVRVTNIAGTPVSGATVSVSATDGILTPASGTTDVNGVFKPYYTAPDVTGPTEYTISATASMAGYTEGSGSSQLIINPAIRIRSGDGLELALAPDGDIKAIFINGTSMPMLDTRGGFSYREVLSNPPNLLENPGFESVIISPANWSMVTVNGSTPVWDNISHSGARSIKISVPGAADNNSGFPRSDYVKVQPLKNYTLSAWVKTLNAYGTYTPAVRIAELDASKKWLRETSLGFSKGTNNWTQKQVTIKTTANTSLIYVYSSIWNGYGTFWVDDVTLTGAALANTGFENSTGSPMNWSFVAAGGNTPVWDNISHGGTRSIKISIPGTKDNQSGYPQSGLIKAEPLAHYTFSAWGKTQGAGGTNAPTVRVVELDASKKWLRQTYLAFGKGTNDWTHKQITFQTGFDTSYLYIYGNIWNGYGTFWMDDIDLSPLFGASIHLNGTITSNPDGTATQRAKANDIDFTFHYIPKGMQIELQGKIQDKRGVDRALQVMYNLPVNAEGWRWGDYIRGSREINGSTHYENVYEIGDVRTQSTYPFASIDNNTHGMSIAVPMDVPRIYRKGYDLSDGYSIQYDFGLSNQTLKIGPGFANFTLALYKTDEPEWGFRAVVKKYYEMYPQFFEKGNEMEGITRWQLDNVTSLNIKNVSDFGFAFDESFYFVYNWDNIKNRYIEDANNKIYTFQYTEPWGLWKTFGVNPIKPSYNTRISALEEDLLNGSNKNWRGILPMNETALAVMNSALYDENGKMYLDDDNYFWQRIWDSSWNQNYPTNPDPDIPIPNRFNISIKKYQMDSNKDGGFIEKWQLEHDASWDSVIHHSGNHSAKIMISGSSSKISGRWIGDKINVKPNTRYTFSAWGKTDNAGGNYPAVRVVEINKQGIANSSSQKNLIFWWNKTDWRQQNLTFTTLNDTYNILIYANIWNGYGTFWLDDVKLNEINSEDNLIPNSGFEINERGNSTFYETDGIAVDSVTAGYLWSQLENYRIEHQKYTDIPLIFSYTSKRVIILQLFSNYEFLEGMRESIGKNKLIYSNIFPDAYNFYGHIIDVAGGEIGSVEPTVSDGWYETDKTASYRRILSYQKTNVNIMQWKWLKTNENIPRSEMENYIKYSTFYAIFPSIQNAGLNDYFYDKDLYERDRDLFKNYIPIISNISKAGWEPITYATIDNKNINIERYGYFDKSNLYYTLRNTEATAQNGILVINLSRLGAQNVKSIEVNELISNGLVNSNFDGSNIILNINIDPGDTLVFRINNTST